MLSSSIKVASTQQSVDVIASQTCTEVSSKKKTTRTHFNWSEQQDDILILALLDEVVQGGRCSDNGLKAACYNRVVDKIAPLITNATITVKKVRNRTRNLKQNFLMVKEAIAQSGFNLSEDGRVMADEEVWVRYIEHTRRQVSYVERGSAILISCRLSLAMIKQPANLPLKGMIVFPKHHKSILIDLDESQTVGDGEGECSHGNAPREKAHTNNSSLPPKRRRSIDVFEQFGTALTKMTDNTGRLADAFMKEPEKLVLPSVMDALKAIPELTTQERVHALHKMGAQPFLVNVFFAMDEENRFEWVKSDVL